MLKIIWLARQRSTGLKKRSRVRVASAPRTRLKPGDAANARTIGLNMFFISSQRERERERENKKTQDTTSLIPSARSETRNGWKGWDTKHRMSSMGALDASLCTSF